MAGLIQEPSGCGPGTPRPADTPQEGVRSVRVRDAELAFAVYVARIRIAQDARVNLTAAECLEVARMCQACADKAMTLHAQLHAAHAAQGGGR